MFFLSFLNKSSEFENHKKNAGELETKLIDSFHENLKTNLGNFAFGADLFFLFATAHQMATRKFIFL